MTDTTAPTRLNLIETGPPPAGGYPHNVLVTTTEDGMCELHVHHEGGELLVTVVLNEYEHGWPRRIPLHLGDERAHQLICAVANALPNGWAAP